MIAASLWMSSLCGMILAVLGVVYARLLWSDRVGDWLRCFPWTKPSTERALDAAHLPTTCAVLVFTVGLIVYMSEVIEVGSVAIAVGFVLGSAVVGACTDCRAIQQAFLAGAAASASPWFILVRSSY